MKAIINNPTAMGLFDELVPPGSVGEVIKTKLTPSKEILYHMVKLEKLDKLYIMVVKHALDEKYVELRNDENE